MRKQEGNHQGQFGVQSSLWEFCCAPSQFLNFIKAWLFEISGNCVFVVTGCGSYSPKFCFLFAGISCSNMDLVPQLSSVQLVRTTLWHPILCTHPLPGHFLEAHSPDLPLPFTSLTGAAIGSVQPWAPLQSQ